jgi:hypothetical protein
MSNDYLAGLAAMFVFWCAEFGVLTIWRTWMVRAEILNWCGIGHERRRIIALLMGMAGSSIFAVGWIGRSMWSWMAGRWHPNEWLIALLVLGLFSVMSSMWWACCSVLGESRGTRIWWINLWIGLGIGAAVSAYSLSDLPI